jgi:hypothetical protein
MIRRARVLQRRLAMGLLFAGMAYVGLPTGCAGVRLLDTQPVTFESLLARTTNLHTFASAPLGPSFLESSYDRSGGNTDWLTFDPAPDQAPITLLELDGPGYLSRFWIASFDAERWHFYIDGEAEPRLDLAKEELFGERFPFVPPLAGQSGGGRYSLLPIPFEKSIRVAFVPSEKLTRNSRNYIHINYTLLDPNRYTVTSYPTQLSAAQSNAVVAVNRAWDAQPSDNNELVTRMMAQATMQQVAPGESLFLWQDKGAGLVDALAIRIDDPSPAEQLTRELLRRIRLRMTWNGAAAPSVDVPLGDFFCNAFYTRSFSAMPLARLQDTFLSRFPLPYQRGAAIELINLSDAPVTLTVAAQGNREDSEGLTRLFHADWRATTQSGQPFVMLETTGSGHYVGAYLTAIGQDGTWNILEGDEVLRPDPDRLPPQHGTGLEDYFNGAYYYTSLFDLPLHGLIEKGAMRTDQYRLHLLDGVPFDEQFSADIEFGHGNHSQGYLSSLLYWYADQPTDQTLDQADLALLPRPADRFETAGIMAQLFLLERDGLHSDAAARTGFFADRYAQAPWSDVLRVREAGYREVVEGFEVIQPLYQELTRSTFPPAAEAASNRLWLAENPNHALLGIHALAKYRLRLNDEVIAEAENPNQLTVQRLVLTETNYVWDVDLAPTHQGSFFSLALQQHDQRLNFEGPWETVSFLAQPGQGRPDPFLANQVLPNMTVWAFEPNAYVDLQSPANGIRLWAFWAAQPIVRQVRLRHTWQPTTEPTTLPTTAPERTTEELLFHAVE